MARRYTVTTKNVSVAAAQDLMQIKGATGKILRIISFSVGATDTSAPTSQMLDISHHFLPATVTDGSGGSTPSPKPTDPGDAAASFTAKANNTTQATTNAGGGAVLLGAWGVHAYSGIDYAFPSPPIVGPSESWVLDLNSTVSGTIHLSTTVLVEELGG